MKKEFDTRKYLKTRHFILVDQLHEKQKMKSLKEEKTVFVTLLNLMHFLRNLPFTMKLKIQNNQMRIKNYATQTH